MGTLNSIVVRLIAGQLMHSARAPLGAMPVTKPDLLSWTSACSRSFTVVKMSDYVFALTTENSAMELKTVFLFCDQVIFIHYSPGCLSTLKHRNSSKI